MGVKVLLDVVIGNLKLIKEPGIQMKLVFVRMEWMDNNSGEFCRGVFFRQRLKRAIAPGGGWYFGLLPPCAPVLVLGNSLRGWPLSELSSERDYKVIVNGMISKVSVFGKDTFYNQFRIRLSGRKSII